MDYNINYKGVAKENNVPDKRTTNHLDFVDCLFSIENQNIHDSLFKVYKLLSSASDWNSTTTYSRRDIVKYAKAVYQSLEDNNTDNPAGSSKWFLISENFLGLDFRLKINSSKLALEFAINTWFGTTFRQPPLVSDIFFTTNNAPSINVFRVGGSENNSSVVYNDKSSEFVINQYNFNNQYNANLNVPVAVFNTLGTTNLIRNLAVRDFVDKYIAVGIKYLVTTY